MKKVQYIVLEETELGSDVHLERNGHQGTHTHICGELASETEVALL